MLDISGYIKFMKDNKIFIGAVTFFIGGQMRSLMEKVSQEIIIPFIKADKKKLSQVDLKELLFLIVQLFLISYLFYKLYDNVLEEI